MQDQYINHIMNETGATVILRGRGSGNLDTPHGEGMPYNMITSSNFLFILYFSLSSDSLSLTLFFLSELQQPLHLYLSSNNLKSLEDAKLLAENLLDTISIECGASRSVVKAILWAVAISQDHNFPMPVEFRSIIPGYFKIGIFCILSDTSFLCVKSKSLLNQLHVLVYMMQLSIIGSDAIYPFCGIIRV